MSNNFPAVPADIRLCQLTYVAILPGPALAPGSALDFGSEVSTQLVYSAPNLGASFTFATPGQFGTFDQQAFEAMLSQSVTAVVEVLAGMSGQDAGALQAQVNVVRSWQWTDGSGYQLSWQDQMTYPVTLQERLGK